MDDWESFIANVEQSAPQEDIDDEKHRCQECDTVLENIDGDFVCPGCSAQATNILQLEQTDVFLDESGQIYLGQRVNLHAKKSRKHKTAYGWAWSTDDAIVHILSLQIEALEKLGLVPKSFRPSIMNMWLKYWLENVAPFIKDEYNERDLTLLRHNTKLKARDIEVLIKVQDKVMIPEWVNRPREQRVDAGKRRKRKRKYPMLGTKFQRGAPQQDEDVDIGVDGQRDIKAGLVFGSQSTGHEPDLAPPNDTEESAQIVDLNKLKPQVDSTKNVNRNNVNILTLNRTLAFIEATARLVEMPEPLFASDIVRACTQRLIPFYGAQKVMPENMTFNNEDRLLFKTTSPPSTNQLTRATSQLIYKVYQDKFPLEALVPDINVILERFIEDMNLPYDIMKHVSGVDFSKFGKTREVLLPTRRPPTLQHFDRWAFAILICQLKKLYSLDEESLLLQAEQARQETERTNQNQFIAQDWLRQLSIRLRLIMIHDPYVLHHPMVSIRDLAPTGQMFKQIEATLNDKAQTTCRFMDTTARLDSTFRNDLTDFLKNEIPRPRSLGRRQPGADAELSKPTDLRHPLQDSFRRTQSLWISHVEDDEILMNLLFKDFTHFKVLSPDHGRRWSIYDTSARADKLKLDISPEWPYFFRMLLHVGGFICFCEPQDLLREVHFVEEYLYTGARTSHRIRNISLRSSAQQPNELD